MIIFLSVITLQSVGSEGLQYPNISSISLAQDGSAGNQTRALRAELLFRKVLDVNFDHPSLPIVTLTSALVLFCYSSMLIRFPLRAAFRPPHMQTPLMLLPRLSQLRSQSEDCRYEANKCLPLFQICCYCEPNLVQLRNGKHFFL